MGYRIDNANIDEGGWIEGWCDKGCVLIVDYVKYELDYRATALVESQKQAFFNPVDVSVRLSFRRLSCFVFG